MVAKTMTAAQPGAMSRRAKLWAAGGIGVDETNGTGMERKVLSVVFGAKPWSVMQVK